MDIGLRSALDFTPDETAACEPVPSVNVRVAAPFEDLPPGPVARGFPLAMATVGSNLRLVSYDCGRNAQRRLADQGLTVGVSLSIVSNDLCGPMIVMVRGTRIGLGKGLAHKVMVSEAEKEQ